MSLRKLLFCAVLAVCSFAVSTSAQTSVSGADAPRTISYQALLTGVDGKPVEDGAYTITVRLYADTSDSFALWESTFTTPVTSGMLNLALGSGDKALPEAEVLGHASYMSIQLNGQNEMRPFTHLAAAPHALTVADGAVSTSKITDGAITKSKMGTDYIGALTINGQRISGRGENVSFVAGNGLKMYYDEASKTVILAPESGSTFSGKGQNALTNDLDVKGNAYMHNNSTLGDSATHFIKFIAHAATDLDMYQYDLNNVDTLKMGKASTRTGAISLYSASKSKAITLVPDTTGTNYTYTIPNVGTNAKFMMSEGPQIFNSKLTLLDTLKIGSTATATGAASFYYKGSPFNITLSSDSAKGNRNYKIPDVGSNANFLMSAGTQTATTKLNLLDTLKLGSSAFNGSVAFYNTHSNKRVTVRADSAYANRTYRIPDVGVDADFLMNNGTQQMKGTLLVPVVLPATDGDGKLGSADKRYGDMYLGPHSLHLSSTPDEGVTADWVSDIITNGGDSTGSYRLTSGDATVMVASNNGDVGIMGAVVAGDGLTTGNDIVPDPTLDNALSLGTPDNRFADVFLGPHSLHLSSTPDEGVAADWTQEVLTNGDSLGSYSLSNGDDIIMTASQTGDVTITGGVIAGDGLRTGSDIVPTDGGISLGTPEDKFADLYLGPHSLHLTSTIDEGVTADWTSEIITSGDSIGQYSFTEGDHSVMTASNTGDVTITGGVIAGDGLTTGNDIVPDPTLDNALSLGTPDNRFADVFLGPHSLHLSSTPDEGVTADWTQEVLTNGDSLGSYSLSNGDDIIMTASRSGDVTITGGVIAGDGLVTSNDIVPDATLDNAVSLGTPATRFSDLYLGPHSLHITGAAEDMPNGQQVDWIMDLSTIAGPTLGNLQFFQGTSLLMSLTQTGTMTLAGSFTANNLAGNGSAITSLNAAQLTTGTVPSARLTGTYSSQLNLSNAFNTYAGSTLNISGAANSGSVSTGSLTSSTHMNSGLITTGSLTTSGNVNAGSVTSNSMTNSGAINTATLNASGAATTGSLSTGAVASTSIANSGAVNTATLNASGAATTGSLNTGAVTSSSITNSGAVNTATLSVSGAATTGSLNTGAVSSSSISNSGALSSGSVSTGALTSSSINTSGAISAGSVTSGSGSFSNLSAGTLNATTLSSSSSVNGTSLNIAGNAATNSLSTGNITSSSISNFGAITTASLSATGAVSSGSVSTGGVASSSITNSGAISTGSLNATGAVTSGSVSTGAVSSASISNSGAVTTNALSSGSITNSGNVTSASLNVSGATTLNSLSADAITSNSIANAGSVSTSSLNVSGSATTGSVNTGNISSASIANSGAITTSSLSAASATVSGSVSAGSVNASSVTSTAVTATGTVTGGSLITNGAATVGSLNTAADATLGGDLRMKEPSGSGNNVTIFHTQAQANDITYTLPATQGGNHAFLQNDGSGVLSWVQTSSNSWGQSGNAGTNVTTDFMGTTDNMAVALRTNNVERMRVTTDGKLGVGTDNPIAPLHVDPANVSSADFAVGHGSSAAGNNTYFTIDRTSATGGKVKLDAFNSGGGGTQILLNPTYGGNVGIGVSNAGALLDVGGTAHVTGELSLSGGLRTPLGAGILRSNGAGSLVTASGIALENDATGTLAVTHGGTGTQTAMTPGSLVFAGASGIYNQNNAKLFWNDASAKLGVGTVPAAGVSALDIAAATGIPAQGDVRISRAQSGNVGGSLTLRNSAASAFGNAASLFFNVGNAASLDGSGNSIANAEIRAVNVDNGTKATDVSFRTWNGADNVEMIRMTSYGNVGIGIEQPDAKLDVNGGANVRGDLTAYGTLNVGSTLTAANSAFNVASDGSISADGSLSVAGDVAVGANKFNVSASNGNLAHGGSTINGYATVSAGANINIPANTTVVTINNDGNNAANNVVLPSGTNGQMIFIYNNDAQNTTGAAVINAGKMQQLIYAAGAWRHPE